MSVTIAFLGLGVMGYPTAGHLANAGYEVRVYNRTPTKAEKWLSKYQGTSWNTPAEAVEGADYIFSCVGNDDDLREITLAENGTFPAIKAGAIYADLTTVSANVVGELSVLAKEYGFEFLDAPVSGGQAGAENGQLSVMVGGDADAFERIKPIMDVFSKSVLLMGDSGAGQLTKMVNQICIAGLLQSLSEGIHFAQSAGLDTKQVISAISKGAAQSWQMENRHEAMSEGEFDFGFAVDWIRKDLAIVLNEAQRNGARLPVTALVDQFYADVQAAGGGRWDTSSLISRLTK